MSRARTLNSDESSAPLSSGFYFQNLFIKVFLLACAAMPEAEFHAKSVSGVRGDGNALGELLG